MKPRCEVHNAPLRWVQQFKAWVCFRGVRENRSQKTEDRREEPVRAQQCNPYRRDFPAPFRPHILRQTRRTWDGRELLSPADYEKRCIEVWRRDGKRCQFERMTSPGVFEICGALLPVRSMAEIHHKRGRGMGGGFRDDAMENLATGCKACHRAAAPQWNGMVMAAVAYGPVGAR